MRRGTFLGLGKKEGGLLQAAPFSFGVRKRNFWEEPFGWEDGGAAAASEIQNRKRHGGSEQDFQPESPALGADVAGRRRG